MALKIAEPMTEAGSLSVLFGMILLQLQSRLSAVEVDGRGRDDVRSDCDASRRLVPTVSLRQGVALLQEAPDTVGLELGPGEPGPFQRVAERRRVVDAAVEVPRRLGDGQGELEDER